MGLKLVSILPTPSLSPYTVCGHSDLVVFRERVALCISGCYGDSGVAQAGLEPKELLPLNVQNAGIAGIAAVPGF